MHIFQVIVGVLIFCMAVFSGVICYYGQTWGTWEVVLFVVVVAAFVSLVIPLLRTRLNRDTVYSSYVMISSILFLFLFMLWAKLKIWICLTNDDMYCLLPMAVGLGAVALAIPLLRGPGRRNNLLKRALIGIAAAFVLASIIGTIAILTDGCTKVEIRVPFRFSMALLVIAVVLTRSTISLSAWLQQPQYVRFSTAFEVLTINMLLVLAWFGGLRGAFLTLMSYGLVLLFCLMIVAIAQMGGPDNQGAEETMPW